MSYPPFDIASTQQPQEEDEKGKAVMMQVHAEEENQDNEDVQRRQSRRTEIWSRYGVEGQKYVLFLSRWSEGKGLEDLVQGYLESKVCKEKKWPLLLCTTTPAAGEAMESSSAVSLALTSPRRPPPPFWPSLSSTSSPVSSFLTSLSSSTSSSPSRSFSPSSSTLAPSSPSSLLERGWQQADQLQHLAPHGGSTISGDGDSTSGDTERSSTGGRLGIFPMPTTLIRIVEGVTEPVEKAALFYGCAAFVLPSKATPSFTETFGIVVVEKVLAGGLGPVLTTRTGGLLEATGGHCVDIDPSSPQSIMQQLDWVCNGGMDEAAKRAMAEAARKHALKFDRAKVLRELMSLVEG